MDLLTLTAHSVSQGLLLCSCPLCRNRRRVQNVWEVEACEAAHTLPDSGPCPAIQILGALKKHNIDRRHAAPQVIIIDDSSCSAGLSSSDDSKKEMGIVSDRD